MYTLGDARTFVAAFVGEGACSTDQKVVDALEEASELLMQEANWQHSLAKIRVCTYNQCLTLPRNVETVLKVDFGVTPANTFSQAYEFLSGGPGLIACGNNTAYNDLIEEGDGYPTFYPIGDTEHNLIALSTDSADQNVEIRVRGINELGMDISPDTPGEMIPIMQWKSGEEGRINYNRMSGFVSDNKFQKVISIHKPVTKGYISLFSYDEDTDNMWLLGKYHPDETVPGYRRYRITASTMTECESVTMLVKLKHVPFEDDTDILPIQSLTAYKYMCRYIHQTDYGDPQTAELFFAKALRVLNKQYENSHPPTMDFDVNIDEALTDRFTNIYG